MNYIVLIIILIIAGFGPSFLDSHESNEAEELSNFADRINGTLSQPPKAHRTTIVVEGKINKTPVSTTIKFARNHNTSIWHYAFRAPNTNPERLELNDFEIQYKSTIAKLITKIIQLITNSPTNPVKAKYSVQGDQAAATLFFENKHRLNALQDLLSQGITQIYISKHSLTAYGANIGFKADKLLSITTALAKLANNDITLDLIQSSQSDKQINCPYCKATIPSNQDDLTHCPTCKTIHHSECFAEAGGCTVYACENRPRRQTITDES